MDTRYCSVCVKKLTPLFFLQDTSSLPSSKVFATCYICREKANLRNKKKRSALQEIDPNIGPPPAQRRATSTSRVSFSPSVINHGLIPPGNPLLHPPPAVQRPVPWVQPPLPPPPVQRPVSPVQSPQPPLPDTFIPTDQWQTITEFHNYMNTIKMEECT